MRCIALYNSKGNCISVYCRLHFADALGYSPTSARIVSINLCFQKVIAYFSLALSFVFFCVCQKDKKIIYATSFPLIFDCKHWLGFIVELKILCTFGCRTREYKKRNENSPVIFLSSAHYFQYAFRSILYPLSPPLSRGLQRIKIIFFVLLRLLTSILKVV